MLNQLWKVVRILFTAVITAILAVVFLGMQTSIPPKTSILSRTTLIGVGSAAGGNVNTYTFSPVIDSNDAGGISSAGSTFGAGFIAKFSGQYGHVCVFVNAADGANNYELGFYAGDGSSLLAHTTAASIPSTGLNCIALNTTLTLAAGTAYIFAGSAVTSNTATFDLGNGEMIAFKNQSVAGSVFPASFTPPANSYTVSGAANTMVDFWLYP